MEYLERMETMETMKERTKEKTKEKAKERAKIRKPCIRLHGHAFYFDEHTHTHTHTRARARAHATPSRALLYSSLLTYTFFCILGSSRTRGGPST